MYARCISELGAFFLLSLFAYLFGVRPRRPMLDRRKLRPTLMLDGSSFVCPFSVFLHIPTCNLCSNQVSDGAHQKCSENPIVLYSMQLSLSSCVLRLWLRPPFRMIPIFDGKRSSSLPISNHLWSISETAISTRVEIEFLRNTNLPWCLPRFWL